jgi:tyrosine-protein kinase Etk/Wzc
MTTAYQNLEAELRARELDHMGLLDLLIILSARKRMILSAVLAGCAISAGVAFSLHKQYTATAVITPPQQQRSAAAVLLGQLGGVAGMAGAMGSDLVKSQSDLYIGLLGSRSIADNLIAQFHLQQVYDTPYHSLARKTLVSRTHFQTGKDTLIRILVEDVDPRRAAALANGYVDELFKQNSRLAATESAQRRKFFEQELESERRATADAEAALRRTQERTGLVEVGSQIGAALRAVMEVRGQIAGREVMLERMKAGATEQNPEVVLLRSELAALREQERKLESNTARRTEGTPRISTGGIPETSLEYMRRFRDVKFHETLMELVAREYEAARLDQSKEAPAIQVVDRAVPPDLKSWPPRALLTLAGGVVFGLFACLWALAQFKLAGRREADAIGHLLNSLSNGHLGVKS